MLQIVCHSSGLIGQQEHCFVCGNSWFRQTAACVQWPAAACSLNLFELRLFCPQWAVVPTIASLVAPRLAAWVLSAKDFLWSLLERLPLKCGGQRRDECLCDGALAGKAVRVHCKPPRSPDLTRYPGGLDAEGSKGRKDLLHVTPPHDSMPSHTITAGCLLLTVEAATWCCCSSGWPRAERGAGRW